jgi:conjugative relaxase-like TrwC/TraI family protein
MATAPCGGNRGASRRPTAQCDPATCAPITCEAHVRGALQFMAFVDVTMGLQRITAGSGYDYLTRQVAAMDSSEKGHTALASYYSEKGEVPGRWLGSGMAGIEGLAIGDIVTAEQMRGLFGSGYHPLARQRTEALTGPDLTDADYRKAQQLGRPYKVFDHDVSPFRVEVARRLESLNKSRGLPRTAAVAIEDRARIRTAVGLEMFRKQHGRDPLDQRELSGWIAKLSRRQTTAVAGFDMTFSPVKSVSTLWALADSGLAARIEKAHHAAVDDALRFIERSALFTRTGRNGVRQVEVRGLVAAAFLHRDSRAGDPDLHTHVAAANKVQTVADGRWLSIDGRVLYKAAVAASETYNTALERHLGATLGLRFEARPGRDPRKRMVREVVGVDAELIAYWSSRRRSVETRQGELATAFQRRHGRPATPVEAISLAQQAALETRQAKHEPRAMAEQRAAWQAQATRLLGSREAITTMINATLNQGTNSARLPDPEWMKRAAGIVVDQVQQHRSTWQVWHLRAEALRAARAVEIPVRQIETFVDLLVDQATALCRPLRKPDRPAEPSEPEPLRRSDGASVYTVAGAQLFTSAAVLDAEARLVTAAGLKDGRAVPAAAIDLALLEAEADGRPLNPGQALLVREMAGSCARLELAIAPAGSGKTTAMSALSRAWITSGGTVLGLAPSAASAAELGEQLPGHTDTLAKLAWAVNRGEQIDWVASIGPTTLVIVDEAGMADTLALDAVVSHVIERGGSIRLIGDDQQLAAIGAGGVLRDIQATHGAVRLTELVRFADRAEGSASLALRQGQTSSLGFYLDRRRIHVGDETTMADEAFAAWSGDMVRGLDSIMLAPTRELVCHLNQRARAARLVAGGGSDRAVLLADGSRASVGDTVITRSNNRALHTSPTDWVKNGDRWRIIAVPDDGSIHVSHSRTGRRAVLPASYVRDAVELGYACTTHSAQGVTADTMHGLLSGNESRQQAYTMLTRGREANHAYLVVVGDGDPHTLIYADTINPPSPTDLLERILARDDSPVSATTSLREACNPVVLLGDATARYSDAIGFAAGHILGETGVEQLEQDVQTVLPRITQADTWPALRAQLVAVAADGGDPLKSLARACAEPLLDTRDPCSVLAWRVAEAESVRRRGPLPWLPGIPRKLTTHPVWGEYLTARLALVEDLAGQVRTAALVDGRVPGWAEGLAGRPSDDLVADIEVWRAAHQIDPTDLRPTGEAQHGIAELRWQRHLTARLAAYQSAALSEWVTTLRAIAPTILDDDFAPILAARLSQLSSGGTDALPLLTTAAEAGPLPDDHAAAALWWRIARNLGPTVDDAIGGHQTTAWVEAFTRQVGEATSRELQDSPWWPGLTAVIERGLQRGWSVEHLIDIGRSTVADGNIDLCQGWIWRLSPLTDTYESEEEPTDPADEPPSDLYTGWEPPEAERGSIPHGAQGQTVDRASSAPETEPAWDGPNDDAVLALEGRIRATMGPPEPAEADLLRMMARADAIADSPVHPDRLSEVNALTVAFFERHLTGSWARPYLAGRLSVDPAALPNMHAGYAPGTWDALVAHLRRHGVTDVEMITAGVALEASTGRLIDRFRDRLTLPIVHNGQVLGFVARRNPRYADGDRRGPKYLNTAATPLYSKSDHLFVAGDLDHDQIPVIVEGPLDAWAVTLVGAGKFIGAAALGTSLTESHVAQLHQPGRSPVVATDADLAGQLAAEKDYWLLAMYNMAARHARLPTDMDPCDLLSNGRGDELRDAVAHAGALADTLIDERLAHLPGGDAAIDAVRVLAAQSGDRWTSGAEHIARATGVPAVLVRTALADMVHAWNQNPRRAAIQALTQSQDVRSRLMIAMAPTQPSATGFRPRTGATTDVQGPVSGVEETHGRDRPRRGPDSQSPSP